MFIKSEQDEIQSFLVDASNFQGYCDAVYFPENEEDIVKILTAANKNKTPVTVAGNGTGLTGARVPLGGIVISTEKMNRIIEINKEEGCVIIQPAVMLSDMLDVLKENGLLYPPDPTEKNCYVGATIATNASGAKTFKYGPTRDYVIALDVVLPTGETVFIERGKCFAESSLLSFKTRNGNAIELKLPDINMPNTKNASGYFINDNMDLIDLFIGSEGTLGIITKAKLRIIPYPPQTLSCVVFFPKEIDGLEFVAKARERSRSDGILSARALEYFDRNSLQFLKNDFSEVDDLAYCAVWFEQEYSPETEDILTEEWFALITECNGNDENVWAAIQDSDKERIAQFRHAVPSKVNEFISRNGYRKLGTDVAVPDDKFNDFYFYAKKLVLNSGLNYVCYGHFGNSHIHLNMLPTTDEEFLTGKSVYKLICQKAVELHGTVSAEHGIGKIKTDYLMMMYGEKVINEMKSIKKTLDPNFILGRGTMFEFVEGIIY